MIKNLKIGKKVKEKAKVAAPTKKTQWHYEVLSEEESAKIGLLIRKFDKGEITFPQFVDILKGAGISVKPWLNEELGHIKRTIAMAKEYEERKAKNEFLPNDIHGYYISSKNYENVYITYDISIIKILANQGDIEARKHLDSIVEWQEDYMYKHANYRDPKVIAIMEEIKKECGYTGKRKK